MAVRFGTSGDWSLNYLNLVLERKQFVMVLSAIRGCSLLDSVHWLCSGCKGMTCLLKPIGTLVILSSPSKGLVSILIQYPLPTIRVCHVRYAGI